MSAQNRLAYRNQRYAREGEMLGLGIGIGLGIGAQGGSSSDWLLATVFWSDAGYWRDDATWSD